MNHVSHPVGSRVLKYVVLTCAEIYSCIISEAVPNLGFMSYEDLLQKHSFLTENVFAGGDYIMYNFL